MGQPMEFTGTFELRPAGAGPTTPPVATITAAGRVTVPGGVLPVPSPAPAPSAPPSGALGARVRLGAFVYQGIPGVSGGGDPWDPGPHLALEKALGRRLDPVSCFIGWDTDFPAVQFAAYGDRDVLISWHPDNATAGEILGGKWDPYLDRWGTAVDAYRGGKVYLRLMPEMNGSWSRWSPLALKMGIGNPAQYVQVWRYVVARVRARTNRARWVWCPNITDDPGTAGNRLELFYPGHDQVDVLGFDGYNWGDSSGGFRWTSFADLLTAPQPGHGKGIYDRLAGLHPSAPIWVCEFGCKEPAADDGKADVTAAAATPGWAPVNPGRSKAQWYTDALRLTGFPRLTTLVMFDVVKERDWRITSSPGVVAAITANLTAR